MVDFDPNSAETESGALIQHKLSPCLEQADLYTPHDQAAESGEFTRISRQQLQYSNNKTSGHKIRAKAPVNVVTHTNLTACARQKIENGNEEITVTFY